MNRIAANKVTALDVGLDTHPGETGKANEDTGAFYAYRLSDRDTTEVYLGVVADGIGGHQAGERASRMAVEIIERYFRETQSPHVLEHLERAFQIANEQIVVEGDKKPEYHGMGTTVTAAVMMAGRLYVAHDGDSRAYLIRDGRIHQLTIDHTWVQEAVDRGRLTPEEARIHPRRNVIKRYLGIQQDLEVDFRLHSPDDDAAPSERHQGLKLEPGDMVLLCSDGLSDLVPADHILMAASRHDPQVTAEQLVKMARDNGGYDNITVVIMKVPGEVRPVGAGCLRRVALGVAGIVTLAGVLGVAFLALGNGFVGGSPTRTPTVALLSDTPTNTASITPTGVATTIAPAATLTLAPRLSPTGTDVHTPTEIPTEAATPTSVPTRTPTHTFTPRPTPTRTPTQTATPVFTPTRRPEPEPKPPSPQPAPSTPVPPPPEPTNTPEPEG
jgi:protein phosphatase